MKPEIIIIEAITNSRLMAFIRSQGLSVNIAREFIKQITFNLNNRQYCGIGIPCQDGEWRLYVPDIELIVYSSDSMSVIKNMSSKVCVFVDYWDFLNFIQMTPNYSDYDFIVLHSYSRLKVALPLLIEYCEVVTNFDVNDDEGFAAVGIVRGLGLSFCKNITMGEHEEEFGNSEDINDDDEEEENRQSSHLSF